jgi:hypothetical protein
MVTSLWVGREVVMSALIRSPPLPKRIDRSNTPLEARATSGGVRKVGQGEGETATVGAAAGPLRGGPALRRGYAGAERSDLSVGVPMPIPMQCPVNPSGYAVILGKVYRISSMLANVKSCCACL